MYIRDLKKLRKDAEALRKQGREASAEFYRQADEKEKELRESCHHPKQYVKVEKSEFGGSYYDKASTTYTPVCTLCGAKGESETKTHSWYG